MDDTYTLGPTFTGACVLNLGKVSVHSDGRVEIHEGATIDEAATAFWEGVNNAWPGFLKQPNKHLEITGTLGKSLDGTKVVCAKCEHPLSYLDEHEGGCPTQNLDDRGFDKRTYIAEEEYKAMVNPIKHPGENKLPPGISEDDFTSVVITTKTS